jgi:hypothetical protein
MSGHFRAFETLPPGISIAKLRSIHSDSDKRARSDTFQVRAKLGYILPKFVSASKTSNIRVGESSFILAPKETLTAATWSCSVAMN